MAPTPRNWSTVCLSCWNTKVLFTLVVLSSVGPSASIFMAGARSASALPSSVEEVLGPPWVIMDQAWYLHITNNVREGATVSLWTRLLVQNCHSVHNVCKVSFQTLIRKYMIIDQRAATLQVLIIIIADWDYSMMSHCSSLEGRLLSSKIL